MASYLRKAKIFNFDVDVNYVFSQYAALISPYQQLQLAWVMPSGIGWISGGVISSEDLENILLPDYHPLLARGLCHLH